MGGASAGLMAGMKSGPLGLACLVSLAPWWPLSHLGPLGPSGGPLGGLSNDLIFPQLFLTAGAQPSEAEGSRCPRCPSTADWPAYLGGYEGVPQGLSATGIVPTSELGY